MNRKLLELVPSSSRTPILLFLTFFISSLLLSPSQSISTLYSPQQSSLYEPPSQPRSGPRIKYSIIVPTYHERDNIRPLVTTVFDTLPFDKARETEIIIVDDDSEDSTEEEVEKLKEEGREVSILVRRRVNGKGERGLSSAVLRGFERARGSKLLVMDADLQHPAAFIAPLFDALTDETPFAIGTRYGKGVSMSRDWPMYRRIISWGARMLARPLTSASDPMSGFFAIQKDLFLRSLPINPLGFKIALELLLKTPLPSHGLIEVPYSFATRTLGSSKLGASTILKYVAQLITLYVWKWGFFWHLLVAGGGTVGVVGLRKVLVKIWPHADSAKLRGGRKLFGRSSTGAVCALDPNSHHISTFFTSKMPPPRRTAAQQKRLANAARPRPHTDPTAQANTTTAFRRQLQELRRPEPEEPCDLWQHRCHPSPVDHPEMTEEERDVWAAKWDSHIQRFFSVGRGSRSVLTGLDALPITLHSEAALEYFRTVKKQCHETRFMLTAFVEKFRIKKGPDDFAVFWAKQSVAARRRMATDAFFEMCKVHEQEEAIRALCPELTTQRLGEEPNLAIELLIHCMISVSMVIKGASGNNNDLPPFPNAQFDIMCSRDQRDALPLSRIVRVEQDGMMAQRNCFLVKFITTLVGAASGTRIDYTMVKSSVVNPNDHTQDLGGGLTQTAIDHIKRMKDLEMVCEYCRHSRSMLLKSDRPAPEKMLLCGGSFPLHLPLKIQLSSYLLAGCKKVGRKVAYCSTECQDSDWKASRPAHKTICGKPLNEVFDAPTQSIESHPATLQPQIEYLKDHPDVHYVLFRKPSRPPFEIRIHFVMDMHKGAYNMAMLWARDCDPRAVAYLYSLLVMNIVDETVEKELKHQMAKEYGVDMDMGASLGFPDQSEMPELLRKYVLPNMDGDDDAKRAAFKVQNAVSPSFSESCPFEDLQFARQKYAELEEVLASKARGENPDVPNWLADFMLERRQRGD